MTVTTTGTSTVSASGTAGPTVKTVTDTGVDLINFNTATMLAPMFQLVHRASDLPSSGASGTSGAATENTSPAHTTGSGSSSGSGSNGLLTGAIAGFAVGAVVVGLALLGAFIYLFIKQRKQKKMIAQYAPPPNMAGNMGMSPHDGMSPSMSMNMGMGGAMPPQSMHDGSYFQGSTPLSMKSSGLPQPSPVYEAPAENHQRHELA